MWFDLWGIRNATSIRHFFLYLVRHEQRKERPEQGQRVPAHCFVTAYQPMEAQGNVSDGKADHHREETQSELKGANLGRHCCVSIRAQGGKA